MPIISGPLSCYKCGAELHTDQIGFRTLCETCFSDQHCCLNCRFHDPSRRNECRIPDTDFIADRAKNNLCDEFKVKERGDTPPPPKEDPLEKARKLLGG